VSANPEKPPDTGAGAYSDSNAEPKPAVEHESNSDDQSVHADNPQNDITQQLSRGFCKNTRSYRARSFFKRWKNVLGIVVPSVFSLLLLYVVNKQAVIYQAQLDQARISDRPWVVVNSVRLKNIIAVGQSVSVSIQFSNTGKTPANNTQIRSWIGATNIKDVKDLPRHEPEGIISRGVAPPGLPITQNIDGVETVTQSDIAALNDGTLPLYVWGVIDYDLDPKGIRTGKTEFCYINIPKTVDFMAYKNGNYAK
jgi:hypothetical protein